MHAPLRQVAFTHYEEMSRLGQAFASPVRLHLVDLLRQAPRSVDALAEQAQLPVANVSQHLRALRAAHVVTSERQGQRVVYRLADPAVGSFFLAFRAFSERLLPELDRIKRFVTTAELGLEVSEVLDMVREGRAVVVDVRPNAEFMAAHLDGAITIPLDELPSRLHELPEGKLIVTTCRGPYCPMAVEAVTLLRASGFDAAHVDLDGAEVPLVAGPDSPEELQPPSPSATKKTKKKKAAGKKKKARKARS